MKMKDKGERVTFTLLPLITRVGEMVDKFKMFISS
jgi:hypothetical protein